MRRPLAAAAALLLLPGCTGGEPSGAPAPTPVLEVVDATLGGVALRLEVADEPAEREVGLMRRASVPPGTGMVFLYDAPVEGRFYMYDVPVPLRIAFVRAGTVVSTLVMPPCREADPRACPTYGADGPFDTAVETAPETLPDVRPGDRLVLGPRGS